MTAVDQVAAVEAERRQLIEALALAERDRQLLGYEIHDGIVQDLTAAALLLEGTSGQATFASREAQDNYARGLRLLRASIGEARRLVGGVAATELGEGHLGSALHRLVEKCQADYALPVMLVYEMPGLTLPSWMQHLLLRIVQEALYNVGKHARATAVEVLAKRVADVLELSVRDNGTGFDPAHVPPAHFGLEGMRARARVLGAKLEIESAAGKGTRVALRLNVPAQ
jgi:signal transduction histidine kinase